MKKIYSAPDMEIMTFDVKVYTDTELLSDPNTTSPELPTEDFGEF